jgi:hypothetical protein
MALESSNSLTSKEAILKFTELCEGYKKKVLGIDHLNGSHEKMLVINMIEKYVSVVTALTRVRWMAEKDYRGVEAIMIEASEFVETSLDRITNPLSGREPIINKLM